MQQRRWQLVSDACHQTCRMYFGPRINRLTPNLAEHRHHAAMTFAPPGSGKPRGPYDSSRQRARFSAEFVAALRRDFQQAGPAAIARVRKYQPAAYMKICALLVPRELKVEQNQSVKAMTDEQLERSIELLEEMLAQREAGANAKVVEGVVEPVPALPPPSRKARGGAGAKASLLFPDEHGESGQSESAG